MLFCLIFVHKMSESCWNHSLKHIWVTESQTAIRLLTHLKEKLLSSKKEEDRDSTARTSFSLPCGWCSGHAWPASYWVLAEKPHQWLCPHSYRLHPAQQRCPYAAVPPGQQWSGYWSNQSNKGNKGVKVTMTKRKYTSRQIKYHMMMYERILNENYLIKHVNDHWKVRVFSSYVFPGDAFPLILLLFLL